MIQFRAASKTRTTQERHFMKATKGNFGYVRAERRRRLLLLAGLIALPAAIFITGLLINHTTQNLLTVLAVISLLPACRVIVSVIMIFRCRPLENEVYERIKSHEGSLSTAYELYLTAYEKSAMLEACAVCGNTVVGLMRDPKADIRYEENHILKIMRANGYKCTVNLLTDVNKYIERLDSMNAHADSLRADFHYAPDDRYPDLEVEGLIFNTLLAIAL